MDQVAFVENKRPPHPSRLGVGVCLSLLPSTGSGRTQAMARNEAGQPPGCRFPFPAVGVTEGSFVK